MLVCLWCGFVVAVDKMKYQKYITVMQMAWGVTASNKENCLPPRRRMWVTPSSDASTAAASSVSLSQGKPSLRRIKGRIHRSKSLDSIDLLDSNVSGENTQKHACVSVFTCANISQKHAD
ncbi:hypothetical protein MATL_G00095700 [Megalops atlanticus]|uniref:Uncharacterized protein n=1 Tax=Megalops atlanticus TaxID=7932 RepID=A0A9D3T790_MEGAT|nr:hypothetical protein MATL_G00095700 [Megalops atlanticus]